MEDYFFQYLEHWSYLGLFLVLFAAGLGLPLPEDIPLLAAGWLVSEQLADRNMMIATGLCGVLVGDFIMFSLGRTWGPQIVEHRWFRRILKPWLLDKARDKFSQHGAKIIFAARFMPGLRAVMFVTAGIFRVPYWKFLTFDGTAALISVPLWVLAGSYFPSQIREIMGGTRTATYVVVAAIIVAFVAFVGWEYVRHYRRQRQNGSDSVGVVKSAPLVPPSPERQTFDVVKDKPVAKRGISDTTRVADRLTGG